MRYLLSILLLSVAFITSAENLKVLSINHGIVRVNGKQLQKGSQFDSKSKIVWSDDKQIIKVVGMESHKVNIYAAQVFKVGQVTSIDDLLLQKQKMSSRDGILMNAHDFADFFNRDIALMHSFQVETGYTFDDNHFFFLQYDYLGEKINKRLPCWENMVQFNESIFTIDGEPFVTDSLTAKLFYYDMAKNQVLLLTDDFTIHTAPRLACKQFLDNFSDDDLSIEELSELVSDYCHISFPSIVFIPADVTALSQNWKDCVQRQQ